MIPTFAIRSLFAATTVLLVPTLGPASYVLIESVIDPGEPQRVVLRVDRNAPAALLHTPGRESSPARWKAIWSGSKDWPTPELQSVRLGRYAGFRISEPADAPDGAKLILIGPEGSADSGERNSFSRFFFGEPALIPVDINPQKQAAPPQPPGDLRVELSRTGLIRIPLTELSLDESEISTTRFQHQLKALSLISIDGGDVIFFVEKTPSTTSRTDSIFVTPDSPAPSVPVASRQAFPSLAAAGAEVSRYREQRYELELRYERLMTTPPGDRFCFHRVGFPTASTHNQTETTELPFFDVLTDSIISVRAEIWGYQETDGVFPDHFAELSLEGGSSPRFSWEGRRLLLANFDAVMPELDPTDDALSFQHTVPDDTEVVNSGGIDMQLLDAVRLGWNGYPRAVNGKRLTLTIEGTGGPQLVTVGGFPAGTAPEDLLVLEIQEGEEPTLLENTAIFTDSSGMTAVEFETGALTTTIHVELLSAITGPDAVEASARLPELTELAGAPLERIYVRPQDLAAALQPLIDHRGPGTIVIDPRAAYDCFGRGLAGPEVLREALRWYAANAPSRADTLNVLLAGSATLDPLEHLDPVDFPTIPVFAENGTITSVGAMENASDFPYTLLEGNDEIADARVGRIPAKTPEQLTTAITRIIAHEELPAADSAIAGLFIADRDQEFLLDQPEWISLWEQTGTSALRIDAGPGNGETERTAIRDAFERPEGVLFTLYQGHGNNSRWGLANFFNNNDVATLDVQGRWPFVATFSCLNGNYAEPGATNLTMSEQWLFSPLETGAVANISPVGIDLYFQQSLFSEQFLQGMDQRPETIGQSLLEGQIAYWLEFPEYRTTLGEYVLFGDPESPLRWPALASVSAELWLLR